MLLFALLFRVKSIQLALVCGVCGATAAGRSLPLGCLEQQWLVTKAVTRSPFLSFFTNFSLATLQ